MKRDKFIILLVVMLVTMIGMMASLAAKPILPIDANGYAMQMPYYYSTTADTVVTTTADSTAAPAGTIWAQVIVKDQIIYLRNEVTTTATATQWIQIPAGLPGITIPMTNNSYICYKSLTGTAKVYIIWHRCLE